MPMRVEQTAAGGEIYASPFVGPIDHTAPVRVDVSALTAAEVDERGWLKPGVMLRRNGLLATAAVTAGETIYGVVPEAVKVANGNTAPDLAAAVDPIVAVATHCQVNRAIVEDNLGRALSAGELAAVNAAGGGSITLIY